ncbi:MAG: polysaccharide biosynthesis/export family protein [Candidatus Electrothrix aestuarii]|uniref:Polysaccharide biosynthesis/export family protein n=1 Tax=Candidatus Electrothrix aestuarii TaxID=3062594 RepID=A0AAU8LSY4_9BACT
MIKKKFTLYLLFSFVLILSGCASEQFESNVNLEEFTQQADQLASRTVQQNMFDSVLTAPLDEAESILGPGDLISVNVLESEELNTETRVSSRGYVSLPILDQVEVLGLTAAEAEEKIEQLLKEKYLRDPHVSVFVKEKISDQITLVGAFTTPGNYDYVSGRRLLDIIAVAQGVTEDSAPIAYLSRKDRKTGAIKNYIIDLDALIKRGDMNFNVAIAGGDVIFVPEAGKCFVDGAVRNPGTYPLKGEMTITEAIVLAGGLTAYADNDKIKIIRYTGEGKRNIISLSFSELQEGVGDSIKLQDQDVVYAESSSSGLLSTGLGFSLGFMGTGINYQNPSVDRRAGR